MTGRKTGTVCTKYDMSMPKVWLIDDLVLSHLLWLVAKPLYPSSDILPYHHDGVWKLHREGPPGRSKRGQATLMCALVCVLSFKSRGCTSPREGLQAPCPRCHEDRYYLFAVSDKG